MGQPQNGQGRPAGPAPLIVGDTRSLRRGGRHVFAALLLAGFGLFWQGAAQATVALSANFNPLTIVQGQRSLLTITISNDQTAVLTSAHLLDQLPADLRLYPATRADYVAPTSTCGVLPVFTPDPTFAVQDKIELTGGSVPASPALGSTGDCTITVDVTSFTNVGSGNTVTYTNFIPATNYSDSVNAQATSDLSHSIAVKGLNPPTIGKVFKVGASTVTSLAQGDIADVTITLSNNNTVDLPLTSFTDTLPTNIQVVGASTNTCGGASSNTALDVTLTGGNIAASGNCTITFQVKAQPMPSNATVNGTNSFPAGALKNGRGLVSTASSANIAMIDPIDVAKSFGPSILSSGQTSTLSVFIHNTSASAIAGISLTDDPTTGWPAGVTNAAAPTVSNCGGATVVAGSGGIGFVLSGGTLPANTPTDTNACKVTLSVTATTVNVYTNTIPADAVANTPNFHSAPKSATLDVRNSALTVAKTFTPTNGVAPGDIVKFNVALTNFNSAAQVGVSFTDTLPGTPPMSLVDHTVTGGQDAAIDCVGSTIAVTGTATVPIFTFNLPAAQPGGTVCNVTFTARVPASAVPGTTTYINSTGTVANTGGANGGITSTGSASGSIAVLQPLMVAKTFDGQGARTLFQGSPSVLEVSITNNNTSALSNLSFTDTLPTAPGQLRVANPANATTTCGGTVGANPGDTAITLTGGSVTGRGTTGNTPPPGTCVVRVNVVGGTVGTYTNTIPVTTGVSADGTIGNVPGTTVHNGNNASATLQYTSALSVAKTFITPTVTVGGVSRVRITISNASTSALTGVAVKDQLPTGLTLANPVNGSSTCNGAFAIAGNPGDTLVQLTGATVAPGSSCDFLFDAVAVSGGPWTNTIAAGDATADGGVTNSLPVSAALGVGGSAVAVTKSFTPDHIAGPGLVSQLAITINNSGAIPLTNLGIIDNFPSGMQVSVVPNASTTCAGGIVTGAGGATTISLSGGSLGAAASCQVFINVTSLVVATLVNDLPVGIVTDTQNISNTAHFSANLSALASIGIQKSFTPPAVPPNTRSRLVLQLNNSLGSALTAISGSDNLPAGLTTAVPPNTSTTCPGGTVTATSNTLTFSGVNLPANTGVPVSCNVEVDVVATAPGAYDNFIPGGSLVANGGGVTNPNPGVHAVLNVLNPPTIVKTFSVSPVKPGAPSRVTITITNPNAAKALTNLSLKDTLPTGLFLAPVPLPAGVTNTCGGTVSAIASATSAQIAGATVAAASSCNFQFDAVSNIPGLYTNTIAAGSITTTENVTNPDPATAPLQVLPPPTVVKTFTPPSIAPAGTSHLVITLGNQTSSAQTLTAAFVDNLPPTVVVAAAPAIGGSCTTASVTATAGATSITYANGASIPAGGCTIQVDVTSPTPGTYNNNIPAGALQTGIGSNPAPAVAPLVVSTLGAISGTIYRDDNNDGTHQSSEPTFAGQTVNLLNAGNTVIATTTTDAGGNYLFTGLAAGTYSVVEPAQPAGTLNGKTTVGAGSIVGAGGGTPGTPTAVGTTPSAINTITLLSGGAPAVVSSSINNNFGEIAASDISGTVYRDDNNNGAINGTEPGLAGVTVTLSGVNDLNQPVSLTTVTAADGTYSFTNLRPSCAPLAAPTCPGYVVTEGTQPANTDNGITTAGTPIRDKTLNTSVGTPGTGSNTAPAVGAAAPAPAIPAGTSRIAGILLPPNATSPANNFGEIPNNRTVSGRIFTDNNADGTVNGIDAGVGTGATGANNVAQSLTLSGLDLNGNTVSATTTSDASGNYSFTNLPASNGAGYTVTCTTCTTPAGFVNSAGPLGYPGTTGGTAGGTQVVPLISGINLAGANTISAANNFTKVPPGQQVSGRVFFDASNNGLFDTPADIGLSGQTVELRDNTTNALVKTTTTDANGFYDFTGVVAGNYKIVEPTQPAGTADGKTQAGTVNGAATGVATAQGTTPSTITGVLIGAGQSGANYNFPEIATVSLGGRVFADTNLNGTFDGGDVALQGVVMQLTGTDNFGNAVSRFIGTDVNGQYSFTGLLPGTYTVTENQPSGYTSTQNVPGTITNGTAGTVGALGGTQETVAVTLNGPTSSAPNINFLEQTGTAQIRGFKSVVNQSRPGQQPAPGDIVVWTISYKNESAATQPLQIADALPAGLTRTGAPALTVSSSGTVTGLALNGAYAGTGNLLVGGVTFGAGAVITVNVPAVVQPAATGTLSNQGNPPGSATAIPTNQVDNTTPSLPAGVTVPPNSLPQPSATHSNPNNGVPTVIHVGPNSNTTAAVSGTVWLDNNSNRARDGGDQLLGGWGVAIYNAAGQLVPCVSPTAGTGIPNTTTDCVVLPNGQSLFKTDTSGNYGANGLVPGNYTIKFYDATNTTNPTIVYGTPLNGANNPNSKVATTRDSLNITLAPGQNIPEQDLPLDPSGVVYDSGSRAPIPGSTVQLCGPAGFNPAVMLVGGGGYTVTGNCASMVTGATGLYQFLLTSSAPAGTYTLNATAAGHLPTASTAIPPSPGPHTPAGPSPVRIQAQAGPPTGGAPTTYYLAFNLSPGMPDVIHNHIPLDPSGGGALFLQKAVDRDTVELGDSLQYTLRISAPNGGATNVHITDHLPAGFRLIPGTVIINSTKAPDPVGAPGPNLDFNVGSLTVAGTITTVTYRVRVGVGAQQGDGINRASATATIGGVTVRSNNAQARVKITSGVFFQEACVVGKIFIDCNNNGIQDKEELGIPGVRFYLQDGTYLISDVEGKYSYCGLPARTAVMKVDGSTLPVGSQLVTSSNRNALDPNSLFLDLQMGELHRADFIEGSCGPGIVEQTKARQSKGMVVSPIPEKKPQPKLIFESGSIRDSVPRERDDIMRSCSGGQCTAPASGVTGGAK